jgi:hypothetical protein
MTEHTYGWSDGSHTRAGAVVEAPGIHKEDRAMTDDEARAKAVEAAAIALCDSQLGHGVWASLWHNQKCKWVANAEIQITAYLAAMSAAGWVMVRDCGEAKGIGQGDLQRLYNEGWDDARAAMLKGTSE